MFPTSIMVLFKIHQRFTGHFLNELRVSFKLKDNKKLVNANHLAYIEPSWCGSRISADCQQKLLFTKHDTSGRFLLVTFLREESLLENGRDCIEIKSSFREIRVNLILRITLRVSVGFWILYHQLKFKMN